MEQTVLSVENLHISFRKNRKEVIPAVRDVSFQVRARETLGLVGESGCGKSVTCMSILQLNPVPPTVYPQGRILFEGRDLLAMKPKALAPVRGGEISMIFQEPMTALNPLFTVGYQMIEAIQNHEKNVSRKKASIRSIEFLQKVHLPDPQQMMERYPFHLSGGQRQRVMIAMALATHPKLLIADEPTTALDVTVQAQVLRVIDELKRESGAACIFISHDLGVIRQVANRVAVMYGGRIVEEGSTDQVLYHPIHPYTIGLIQSRPTEDYQGSRLRTIEGSVPALEEMPGGCPFHNRCPYAMERCKERFPDFRETDGHRAACYWAEGVTACE